MMEQVDAAEKEASEVLHSLLSVERIEKHTLSSDHDHQQVVVVASTDSDLSLNSVQQTNVVSGTDDQNAIQWHTPVTVHQALFANMVGGNHTLTGEQVIWHLNQGPIATQQHGTICVPAGQTLQTIGQENYTTIETTEPEIPIEEVIKKVMKSQQMGNREKQATQPKKKPKTSEIAAVGGIDPTRLEENAQQVRERFEKGCECQEENCFKGLSPEYVYRHRLNIAELTKGEHDMYLMGVTMAVLTNPDETVRHKERRRLRAQYVFQGRRVCLDAFLYLENCTHYQLKRIRKHVMTHGVAPRVHGNHGKKPHNTFPLTSYRQATSFLRHFIERNTPGSATQQLNVTPFKCKTKSSNKTAPLYLPSEITRKTIHNAYREYCEHFEPSIKVMGYSTFRQYMKEQFPHVKFCKLEGGMNKLGSVGNQQQSNASTTMEVMVPQQKGEEALHETPHQETQATLIPIVLSQPGNGGEAGLHPPPQPQPTAYIVTPVSQLLQAPTGATTNGTNSFASYQLTPATPTSYATHQHVAQGQVGTITVASVQGNSQAGTYAFTTL